MRRSKTIFWAAFALFVLEFTYGQEKTQKEIVHLAKAHRGTYEFDPYDDISQTVVAPSQFKVAKFIERNPAYTYMVEGIFKRKSRQSIIEEAKADPEFAELMGLASEIFPKGEIPEKFEDLSSLQKAFLVIEGGAETMLYLGKVNELWPESSEEDSTKVRAALARLRARYTKDGVLEVAKLTADPEYEHQVMEVRERATLNEARRHSGERIVIIFGEGHNFGRHSSLLEGYRFTRLEEANSLADGVLAVVERLAMLRNSRCKSGNHLLGSVRGEQ